MLALLTHVTTVPVVICQKVTVRGISRGIPHSVSVAMTRYDVGARSF